MTAHHQPQHHPYANPNDDGFRITSTASTVRKHFRKRAAEYNVLDDEGEKCSSDNEITKRSGERKEKRSKMGMLRDAKLVQRARLRMKGVCTEELAIPADRQAQLDLVAELKNSSKIDEKNDDDKNVRGTLGLDFNSAVNAHAAGERHEGSDEENNDKHMKEFVEKEMDRIRKEELASIQINNAAGKIDDEDEDKDFDVSKLNSDYDIGALYETPKELLVKSSTQRKADAGIGNDSATGMDVTGLSSIGIMEYELPIEAKVANIEATERAKQQFLEHYSGRNRYNQHVNNRATDNVALGRFRKREKERYMGKR